MDCERQQAVSHPTGLRVLGSDDENGAQVRALPRREVGGRMIAASASELVAALRQGSAQQSAAAFDALYGLYSARLMRFVVHLTRDPVRAEDVFQEAWLKLARTTPELGSDLDVFPWLLRVARNDWISRVRRERRWEAPPEAEQHLDTAPNPEQRLQSAQLGARLGAALGRMSEPDREVLLLLGVEGLAYEQAAEILGVSAVALRQRLSRARSRLQAELEMDAKGTTQARLQVVKGGAR